MILFVVDQLDRVVEVAGVAVLVCAFLLNPVLVLLAC